MTSDDAVRSGSLAGVRVVELGAAGPAPFCGMILADHGAEVIRVVREGEVTRKGSNVTLGRGKHHLALNLKNPDHLQAIRRVLATADVLIDPYRPGALERLGLGPDVLLEHNGRLVVGRMTGWGQSGELATAAGHDINYLALAGALEQIGAAGSPPAVPLNLLGDYAGGGLLLAFGITAALHERNRSGRGQVVDAAILDGVAMTMTAMFARIYDGAWRPRGQNMLSGAAPYYHVYECLDGQYLAVGAIEQKFYDAFVGVLNQEVGLVLKGDRTDPADWPSMTAQVAAAIALRSRDEWGRVFDGVDACVTPVLTPVEATEHPHGNDRSLFVEIDGVRQPAPAPRFSRTPPHPGASSSNVEPFSSLLDRWDISGGERDLLEDRHVPS